MGRIALSEWGLKEKIALAEGEILARVIEEQRTFFQLATELGILQSQLAGKFLSDRDRLQRPIVGDWVRAKLIPQEQKSVIHGILPRKSLLKRKAAGEGEEIQPLAANVDLVLIVTSMNQDFNLKRLERYLTITKESGARAGILITKSDLDAKSREVAQTLHEQFKVPCMAISVQTGDGMEELKSHLVAEETVVIVGSSGVGKSTLLNFLLGHELQKTNLVREEDSRGRHTTTSRRLVQIPGGCLLIDTPGLREIQLDSSQEIGLEETFFDLDRLTVHCKFTNCRHDSEPGCAVKAALERGELSQRQFDHYKKLQKELDQQKRKNHGAINKKNRSR